MSETATLPQVDTLPNAATDMVSKESYDRMKAEMEEQRARAASMEAKISLFDSRERERLGGFQENCKSVVQMLMDEGDAEVKADLAPLQAWANDFTTKGDINSHRPLARLLDCASQKFKRERDEASVLSSRADAVQSTMKENEELKSERDNLRQRLTEAESLSSERQEALVTLERELHLAGAYKDKHNFSKLLSREKNAALPNTSEPAAKEEAAPAPTGVSSSVDNASKPSGNPFADDPLFAFVSQHGTGGLRRTLSGTSHAILGGGAMSGDGGMPGDIAAALRA